MENGAATQSHSVKTNWRKDSKKDQLQETWNGVLKFQSKDLQKVEKFSMYGSTHQLAIFQLLLTTWVLKMMIGRNGGKIQKKLNFTNSWVRIIQLSTQLFSHLRWLVLDNHGQCSKPFPPLNGSCTRKMVTESQVLSPKDTGKVYSVMMLRKLEFQ